MAKWGDAVPVEASSRTRLSNWKLGEMAGLRWLCLPPPSCGDGENIVGCVLCIAIYMHHHGDKGLVISTCSTGESVCPHILP